MSTRDPRMEPFEALIGTWATEATHPLLEGVVVPGRVTYEWLEGGHFVTVRSRNEHELFPDGLCVVGPAESAGGLLMEYFDSRGVRRTYGISLEGGVLRTWRDQPGFDQRSEAVIGADRWEAVYELAETPGEWRDDLRVVYRRVTSSGGRT